MSAKQASKGQVGAEQMAPKGGIPQGRPRDGEKRPLLRSLVFMADPETVKAVRTIMAFDPDGPLSQSEAIRKALLWMRDYALRDAPEADATVSQRTEPVPPTKVPPIG